MFEKSSQPNNESVKAMPTAVKTVLDNGIQAVIDDYKNVLATADQSLFQESSFAKNDGDRALYFSAMDECKKKRDQMADAFAEGLQELVADFGTGKEKAEEDEKNNLFATRLAEGNLSIDFGIVEDSDLQEKIVVESMVSKANRMFGHLLDVITEGFNQTMPGLELNSGSNPLCPTPIGDCLFDSFKPANFDARSRLLVYRLFDKGLFLKLEQHYLDGIKSLEASGLSLAEKTPKGEAETRPGENAAPQESQTPETPTAQPEPASTQQQTTVPAPVAREPVNPAPQQPTPVTTPAPNPAPQAPAVAPATPTAAPTQVETNAPAAQGTTSGAPISAIQPALTPAEIASFIETSRIPASLKADESESRSVNKPAVSADTSVLTLSNRDIDKILAEIQQAASLISGSDHFDVLSALGDQLAARSSETSIQAVGQVSENVINLVSILFDFILDDDTLPAELAALITRLQIPFMRLAITDQTLFRNKNHPARLLLNDMAALGIGLESGDSKTFKILQNIVQRLVDDFSGDVELFNAEHKNLLNVKAKLENKISEQEKVIALEEQENDNRVLAYKSVDLYIEEQLGKIEQPLIFHTLLHKAWREILCDVYVENGDESPEWQKENEFFQQIVWSTLTDSSQENKRQLLRVLPKLIQGCEQAFDDHGLDALLKSHFLDQLREIHLKIINGNDGQSLSDQHLSHTQKIEEIIHHLDAPQQQVPEDAPEAIKTIAEERISATEQQTEAPTVADKKIDTHEAFNLVSGLKAGTWFEYQYKGHSTRCKIAYYSVFQEKYTFVSQEGRKLFERDKPELVVDIQDGLCRLLEDSEIFDRALESVIREIRNTEPMY